MIAVVVPAYNSARFLADTIASVRAQGDLPLEVVVVDDGSDDGTAELAESLGRDIRVIRQSNQGPAAARNAGVEASDAELIAFLDADDNMYVARSRNEGGSYTLVYDYPLANRVFQTRPRLVVAEGTSTVLLLFMIDWQVET